MKKKAFKNCQELVEWAVGNNFNISFGRRPRPFDCFEIRISNYESDISKHILRAGMSIDDCLRQFADPSFIKHLEQELK